MAQYCRYCANMYCGDSIYGKTYEQITLDEVE